MNNQQILDKARFLLGLQMTARSFNDLDGVYSHERVIKSTDFLILEISKRDERIAELENVLQGVIVSYCLDEIDERVLVDVLAKGGAL
jgi:hypothetical protein